MTNWLITQTTRFKAAVTGAGAVEHIGNWGNDDTTYRRRLLPRRPSLGSAAALPRRSRHLPTRQSKSPTHMVAGADDIRVAVLEDYLLEHALLRPRHPEQAPDLSRRRPLALDKNPWHGKIKVREELKWLRKIRRRGSLQLVAAPTQALSS